MLGCRYPGYIEHLAHSSSTPDTEPGTLEDEYLRDPATPSASDSVLCETVEYLWLPISRDIEILSISSGRYPAYPGVLMIFDSLYPDYPQYLMNVLSIPNNTRVFRWDTLTGRSTGSVGSARRTLPRRQKKRYHQDRFFTLLILHKNLPHRLATYISTCGVILNMADRFSSFRR